MVVKEDKANRQMELKKEEEKKKLRLQQEEFEKGVRENFKPKVSEYKKLELEQKIKNLKTSPRNPIFKKDESPESYKESLLKPKVIWPDNPLKPKQQPKREAHVIDWLKEQRYKN